MLADDALLFIDANKYLDLYRINEGKKLLSSLDEQVDYIFITKQIVNEVQRNKILVAEGFLRQKFKGLKPQSFNVPDHLSGTNSGQGKEILKQMSEIGQKIKEVNNAVDELAFGILKQISSSQDEVSQALSPIFDKAILHSSEELQNARDRRELGNPPGKSNDPIGDQLTWEQILTHFKGRKRLWIISRDGDYGTSYGNQGFLNRFLYDELCEITSEPEVYLFKDLVIGIRHFVDTTGVKADKRLTPEEADEIEREEKSLPHYRSSTKNILGDNMVASDQIREALDSINRLKLNLPTDPTKGILGDSLIAGGQIREALDNINRLKLNLPTDITKGILGDSLIANDQIRKTLDSINQFNLPTNLSSKKEDDEEE